MREMAHPVSNKAIVQSKLEIAILFSLTMYPTQLLVSSLSLLKRTYFPGESLPIL